MTVSPDKLAAILDVAEDGIITINAQNEIVLFNRGAAKIFGYDPEEVLGKPLEILLPPTDRAGHPRQTAEFARGPVVSRTMGERRTVNGYRKDGTTFAAEVTISKLGDGADRLLTAIVRDADVRKRYEDALVRLNQELEERVKARTAELAERNLQLTLKTEENEMFVYSVSHDLRSPLVNLEGFSDELLTTERDLRKLLDDARWPSEVREPAVRLLDDGVTEPVGFIRTAVGRLGRIIDALLRLSRAGRVEYRPKVVDVGCVVRRVVEALNGTIEKYQAEVVVGDLPPAWADPDAVERVFANLISNALHYLDPSRPGKVEIGSELGSVPTYFVRDNGLGIPTAHQGKLFQALQRLHPNKAPGEGIGLAIVRRILDRIGGTIAVESAPGVGTTFTLKLPPPPAEARGGP